MKSAFVVHIPAEAPEANKKVDETLTVDEREYKVVSIDKCRHNEHPTCVEIQLKPTTAGEEIPEDDDPMGMNRTAA